ncbi:hypothetical protein SAMD00019534_067710, partial [Acytostelium subglobosum LB1]|uniref:hypothetical protein n=1 Tax=Acytostelium subglobosum LB1 TaxID=1410327 RepID=UPI000644D6DB
FNITVTDLCAKEINHQKTNLKSDDTKLRVMVDTGGCSGFQYIFKFDTKPSPEDDVVFTKDNAEIIIDKVSLDMMNGSIIDYEVERMRSTFVVSHNPNTIKSCGCKISFDLKK